MRLLIVTQAVDSRDSNLGFFHNWLLELSAKADLIIITNKLGAHSLPDKKVKIFSLDKFQNNRFKKFREYRRLLKQRLGQVDGVFFHMCPEYVLAAGLLPRSFGKKTLLWYTHKSVNWRLKLAEKLVDKIFTASKESFRLPSKKVEVVGHGIDWEFFRSALPFPVSSSSELKLLTVGRIAPIKNLEVLIRAIDELKNRYGRKISLDIVGSPIFKDDENYLNKLKQIIEELKLQKETQFLGSREYKDLPSVYAAHNIFVHASETGSLDKVVLEALASGLQIFTSSEAYDDFGKAVFRFKKGDYKDLAGQIESVFKHGKIQYNTAGVNLIAERFGLKNLVIKIANYFK
jgi:glycosyltransferase involved in cell wall biosynthesis